MQLEGTGFLAERLRWLSEDNSVIKEREQQERVGDADRKWEGREGGIKRREGLRNQKKAFMNLSGREQKKDSFLLFRLRQNPLMRALPASAGFVPLTECFGLLVSTYMPRNNKGHLVMKEHR